jgi:deazaflavin-dependent oxidoreductase (nitroreductase family)
MAREYRYSWLRRAGNAMLEAALKLGVGPSRMRLLTVTGRKSGKSYTTPVNLVERDGARYLVSPYGERAWVKNARAAGAVRLSRGGKAEMPQIQELPPEQAVAVLSDYWHQNSITRPFFEVGPDAGETFLMEARRHPVFRLLTQ